MGKFLVIVKITVCIYLGQINYKQSLNIKIIL